jgi:methylated-DNA-[protein]-cysteine S-methyltransferase
MAGSRARPTEERTRRSLREGRGPGPDLEAFGPALAARAQAEGLVEVAYAELDSPVGTLLAAATDAGVVRIAWAGSDHERIVDELASTIGPRVLELPARFEELRRELDEYFEGRRRRFEVALDWRLSRGFVRRVLSETARIPFGETRTYAEIAAAAGTPKAFRAAGSALGANPIPIVVPCHRVLRTGGALGGYGGGLEVKRALLEIEGFAG